MFPVEDRGKHLWIAGTKEWLFRLISVRGADMRASLPSQ